MQHEVTLDAVSKPPVRPLETHDARCSSVGECPVWRAEESALYWVDTMCAFGGANLDVLYVTTICPPQTGELDGLVFAIDAGVRGLPEPAFAGSLRAT